MMRSDACVPGEENAFSDINLNAINLEVITKIEKELEVYDLISLVFLLYDVPDTALERLIILQRISRDIEGSHLNLLFEWALSAQGRPTWRQQFLEALAVCQLYSVIRKLGFHVPTVKGYYAANEDRSYINPMKKALYLLCENMNSDTFENFKKTLDSFDMKVVQYDTCELVLLQLMTQKFITLNQTGYDKRENECKIEKLAKIIDRESDLKKYANMLRNIESKMNRKLDSPTTSSEGHLKSALNVKDDNNTDQNEFNEIFNMINELNLEDITIDFKLDRLISTNGRYIIKNEKRVGICCIINQEVFYSSRESMKYVNEKPLYKRDGSTKDKIMLEKTMRSLNFDILTKENLNRKEMITFIQDAIKKVSEEDSVFMLCILSHGIRGCVYAADSIPIKVDFIQNLLDETPLLHGKPKVLILQACQVDNNQSELVADSPQLHLRKTDFLICWATAPEFAAFRHPRLGSLFIQILCGIIHRWGKKEHFLDLFTMVNEKVAGLCAIKGIEQAPIVNHTLRKKLYL